MDSKSLQECFSDLATEARELYLTASVPVLESPPDALTFYRKWVCPNKPVLIRGAVDQWPAFSKWTHDYLRKEIGEELVTVAVTPNGYADAVTDGKFIMPEERSMKFSDMIDMIENPGNYNGIFYCQKQNSSLTDEYTKLIKDCAEEIPWATQAFGQKPDAVNFWIGDERAITSLHKDPYENLYSVVKGSKTFTLIPPTDQPFVPYRWYQAAVYKEVEPGQFTVVDDLQTGKVPWIPIDPLKPDLETYPEYANARSVTVTVHQGETLYLPSLWYHHVQQSHGCIAVNFWYDMEYDIKYNYYKFVEKLMQKTKIT